MAARIVSAGGAPLARVIDGDGGPVVVAALHDGHAVRPGLEQRFALSEEERLREEDPFTARMAPAGLPRIEVLRSRFEVDLNRPRYRSVYQGPQDAWGLNVWRGGLPDAEDRVSRSVYDAFYALAFDVLSEVEERHGRFVVFDVHSYNHRRGGPDGPPADEADNPGVNLGTGRIGDRGAWAPVVDAFSASFSAAGFDIRENVKFSGGHFAKWVTETFPETGCTLAVEFKKTYMDEWTGVPDDAEVERARAALECAATAVSEALPAVR